MKFIAFAILALSLSAEARQPVPSELTQLLPVGGNSVRMTGKTAKNEKCVVTMSSLSPTIFAADVGVYDKKNQLDSRRFAKFQVGLGHELTSIKSNKTTLVANSLHRAEEQYSSNTESQLVVEKTDSKISSVEVRVKEQTFTGAMRVKTKVTCQF